MCTTHDYFEVYFNPTIKSQHFSSITEQKGMEEKAQEKEDIILLFLSIFFFDRRKY